MDAWLHAYGIVYPSPHFCMGQALGASGPTTLAHWHTGVNTFDPYSYSRPKNERKWSTPGIFFLEAYQGVTREVGLKSKTLKTRLSQHVLHNCLRIIPLIPTISPTAIIAIHPHMRMPKMSGLSLQAAPLKHFSDSSRHRISCLFQDHLVHFSCGSTLENTGKKHGRSSWVSAA